MDLEPSGRIYASRINFILFGGLSSIGIIASCTGMNISHLTSIILLVGFPMLFTKTEFNELYVRQLSVLGWREIAFDDVDRYTFDNAFLIRNQKWMNLKSYDRGGIDRLQTYIRLRLGKEAEYQKIRSAARELLVSELSWKEQDRQFNASIEVYDSLPVKLREEVRKI